VFGIDTALAGLSDGSTVLVVMLVAVLLGLRHATDPDHLAAVSTLVASRERSARAAARLGLVWGLGHATTLFAFGLPIVFFEAYLPERLQAAAETAVGCVIVGLALSMLVRWRHRTLHAHAPRRTRTPWQAYGIGLLHGMGGSAGVGVLLLAGISNHVVAAVALAFFALFTAVSMATVSTAIGAGVARAEARFDVLAPALGVVSLVFGVWYSLAALSIAPYVF
jgi:high-affinity nickel permease